MAKKSLADSIRGDIEVAQNKVTEAQEKFDLWSGRLTDAQQEVDRLESALAALEGVGLPTTGRGTISKKFYPKVNIPESASIIAGRNRQVVSHDELIPEFRPVATKPDRVMFNGMEIDLEPGMRVSKNSFGEDCLVPDGMPDLLPMDEPTEVRKPDFSLPDVGSNDRFTDPKDLL